MKAPDLALIAAAVVKAGYPEPEWEFRFHPERKWRFDLAWPELKVAFEREGSSWTGGRHTTGTGYRNDCKKYNAAAVMGYAVIRGTTDMIRSGLALEQLLEALEVRKTAA